MEALFILFTTMKTSVRWFFTARETSFIWKVKKIDFSFWKSQGEFFFEKYFFFLVKIPMRIFCLNLSNKIYFSGSKKPLYTPHLRDMIYEYTIQFFDEVYEYPITYAMDIMNTPFYLFEEI